MLTDGQLGAIRGRLYSIYPGLEESIAEGREFNGTGWDAPDMLALLAEIDRLRLEAQTRPGTRSTPDWPERIRTAREARAAGQRLRRKAEPSL